MKNIKLLKSIKSKNIYPDRKQSGEMKNKDETGRLTAGRMQEDAVRVRTAVSSAAQLSPQLHCDLSEWRGLAATQCIRQSLGACSVNTNSMIE